MSKPVTILPRAVAFRLSLGTLFVVLGLSVFPAGAAEKMDSPAPAIVHGAADEIGVAPVVIDGVELFNVRGASALPADRRAAVITPAYVADPSQAKIVPKDQWYAASAATPSK